MFLPFIALSCFADNASYANAANQDNAQAQFEIGIMYVEGNGVPKNDAEAVKWFRKAAEQGNSPAQFELGFMFAEGNGVPKNYE